MYYNKHKKEHTSFLTEVTYAEKFTGRFDMNEQPTKKQINRMMMFVMLGFLMMCFWTVQGHACESVTAIEMGDGAGSDWSCGNCGRSNKQWEMSC